MNDMIKQFLPALLFAIAFTHLSAQTTITLTFTAEINGIHQPLDSILIQNLTQGVDTTLVGADTVLVLEHGIGIEDGVVQSGNQMILYPAYPNPVASTSTIRLWLPQDESVTLRLFDLPGRELATFNRTLGAGEHSFTFTPGRKTYYLLVVEAADQRQVQKLISRRAGDGSSRISWAGYQPSASGMRKGKSAFPWAPGDALRFAGFTPTSIETEVDNPMLSSSYTFQFSQPAYPPGTVHCDPSNPTEIVDVINPVTGRVWMDRNLGATHVARSISDTLAFGSYYQWGRLSDGHQCRTSGVTNTLSGLNSPGHGNFILSSTSPFDWRVPQNIHLWQGVNGINNPCPIGYRVPTEAEIVAERATWATSDIDGAFDSWLKLSRSGSRNHYSGSFNYNFGIYWSSNVAGGLWSNASRALMVSFTGALMANSYRVGGHSVRCIKE